MKLIEQSKIGCKYGTLMSNIIGYADDIVLLAPSCYALQTLIDLSVGEADNLKLKLNENKTKSMIFRKRNSKNNDIKPFKIHNKVIESVSSLRYLGYILQEQLVNTKDIGHNLTKFYKEFNIILRKFGYADTKVKLYLFKQCCLQIYGSDSWFCNHGSLSSLRDFGVAYHKAIKKILMLSTHESNHFACELANMWTFDHFRNKSLIFFATRMLENSCKFICKQRNHFFTCSYLIREVYDILNDKYNVDSLLTNDKDAIKSRINYVQNHESQMRGDGTSLFLNYGLYICFTRKQFQF